jgi:RNA polymerase-binding transcription factor DksA
MLSPEFIASQKKKLLAEKAFLEDQLQEIGGTKDDNVKDVEDFDINPPSLSKDNEAREDDLEAQEVTSYTNNLSVEDSLEKKLADVNVALTRIESGTYGQCDNCGHKEIPQKRLEALPAARICLDCEQNKAE